MTIFNSVAIIIHMPKNGKKLQATVLRPISFVSILFLSLFMFSCQTARDLPVVPQEPTAITYNEDKNITIDGETFLFIRTYNPHYNNPLSIENILKGLINLVKVTLYRSLKQPLYAEM